jgi:LmbE family N-acetylglucosaminyl deacetylase
MIPLRLFEKSKEPEILCLGAHPDDIEIGCGGAILRFVKEVPKAQFYWVVFSGNKKRSQEALKSANLFLSAAGSKVIKIQSFRESYFPFEGDKMKDYFEKLKKEISPDLIFTHCSNDAHQDHKLISNLTWNSFRDNFIWEFEIPKYDADLGTPNLYVNLDKSIVQEKLDYICKVFRTQQEKKWFDEETFRSILRIRGLESNSASKFAEAFYCRKMVF